jgi:hypothetical protein
MSETDNPLKALITDFSNAFAIYGPHGSVALQWRYQTIRSVEDTASKIWWEQRP